MDMQIAMYENLPKQDSSRGTLIAWLTWHARKCNTKTYRSPLSFSRDAASTYRRLKATHGSNYDSFIKEAEELGKPRFEATMAFANYGYAEQLTLFPIEEFEDVTQGKVATNTAVASDALDGFDTNDIREKFMGQVSERAYKVFHLYESFRDDRTMAEIGQMLDPPISAPTVHRDLVQAKAALYAIGQMMFVEDGDDNFNEEHASLDPDEFDDVA